MTKNGLGAADFLRRQLSAWRKDRRGNVAVIFAAALPTLLVAANAPVADQSAYTVVVANKFALSAGPTMVLNTNYGATDIPVPAGVGPGGTTALVK